MVEDIIETFREYLRIQTVHPDPDYDGGVEFLKNKAHEFGLKTKVIRLDEKRPVLIVTLEGSEPKLPSILLNSHTDVVPVVEKDWNYDPFGAEMDQEGNIYARGAQDMKCVSIAQLEALRRIKCSNVKLKRTVHMSLVPDEEIGSQNGMNKFVQTQAFKDLNVGFDIDEGGCSEDEAFMTFNHERCTWRVLIHCPGTTGHGSLPHKKTAGEKIRTVIDNFMDFRKTQLEKYKGLWNLGDISSLNLTQLEGGLLSNILPSELVVGFDVRVAADANHEDMEKWINDVCKNAGEGVYPEYKQKDIKVPPTPINKNPFWSSMESTLKNMGLKFTIFNCGAATDARFVRRLGIPAIGISAFNHTPMKLHGNDEFMNKNVFLRGISIYEELIKNVANV